MLRFKHITSARNHQKLLAISHDKHRLKLLKVFIRTPILGQFNACTRQLAGVRLKLCLKPFQQRKRISRRSGKSSHHIKAARRQAAHLARSAFYDRLTQRDLTVACNDHKTAFFDTNNCCAMPAGKGCFGHVNLLQTEFICNLTGQGTRARGPFREPDTKKGATRTP